MSYVEAFDFGGTWRWNGDLAELSIITFANGSETTFGSLIGKTNGDALQWWLDEGQSLAIVTERVEQ
jgi:hypothetical protein